MDEINLDDLELASYIDTSAPCSHCVFFDVGASRFKCKFPKDKEKKCTCELGNSKGFCTTEYRFKNKK